MRTSKLLFLPLVFLLLTGCFGSGDIDTLDDPAPASSSRSGSADVQPGQKEIRIGMSASQLNQTLGQADSITTDSSGKEVWTYERKSADFVYTAGQELIIGGYMPNAQGGAPLTVVITFDAGRKVANFSYNQIPF